jgi:RNA polymerase sigma-70 factor (ECF subfamily)
MTMLEERLRAADPAKHVAGYPPVVAAAMLSDITAPAVRARPRVRWISVAAAILLALALLVVPGLSPFHGGATAEAKGLLDRAIIGAVDPPARPDQYWRVTTRSISPMILSEGEWGQPDTVSFLRRSERIAYIAVDGSRPTWFVDRYGPYLRQVSGPPRATPEGGWGKPDAWTTDQPETASDWVDVASLPNDPTLLRVRLYSFATGRGHSIDDEVVAIASDILQTGRVPAAVRKALFEVLKTVPGMGVASRNVTLDGRRGVGLGRTEPTVDERRELVFDADTGEYIGDRRIVVDLEATLEDAISRQLVDQVDPDVVRITRHEHCQVKDGSIVSC